MCAGRENLMEKQFAQWMEEECSQIGVTLSEKQMEQFFQYYEMLIQWNEVMNLTAITEMDQVVTKHFVDSMSLVKAVSELGSKEIRIMDLGTGAGFPGIPLKIAFPNLKLTLLDSLNKRVKFLNEVIGILGLEKIEAVHGRAEDFGRNQEYRGQFDLCVSRAVSNLATLSEYFLPYVKVGGHFISYKSGTVKEELQQAEKAVKILGGKIQDVVYFNLPDSEIQRSLVVIEKIKMTPGRYPRKAGTPLKEPLA